MREKVRPSSSADARSRWGTARRRISSGLVAAGLWAGTAAFPATASASPNCGATANLPAAATGEGTWSGLQSAVAAVPSGSSATFYLTAAITATAGQQLAITSGASVTLDLDGCDLSITSPATSTAAIEVPGGASLTVQDTSATTLVDQGTLTATGGPGPSGNPYPAYPGSGAGIGGYGVGEADTGGSAGSVTIDGGTVVATGGDNPNWDGGTGAGVGGGGGWASYGGSLVGAVTVNGGDLVATGGSPGSNSGGSGAGIGGGGSGANQGGNPLKAGGDLTGTLTVAGGQVTAAGGPGYSGGAGAAVGGGGGGANVSGGGGGSAGGALSGQVMVSGGALTANGGQSASTGGGGAGIGGGGTGLDPGSIGASLTGSVTIAAGTVTATGGASASAGSGAAVGGGGSETNTGGGAGGVVTLTGGSLVATAAGNGPGVGPGVGANGSAGAGGSVQISPGSGAAPQLTGEVDGGLTIDQGAVLSVPSGDALALDGSNTNSGTIDLGGVLAGAGSLSNNGAIVVSGSTWSANGEGPGATPGATITGNAFRLTFSVPTGSPPSDVWVFAPTVAGGGETLPPLADQTGYAAAWTAASATVSDTTPLAALAGGGTVALTEVLTPQPATITVPSTGIYGGGGAVQANAATAGIGVTLAVDPSSTGGCTLSGLATSGTVTTASVRYTHPGNCVIDVTETGQFGTSATQRATIAIAPAPLKITASNSTMTYGGSPSVTTASYAGFVNGDGPASLSTPPSCASGVTSTSPVGRYASSCAGAASADYAITYVGGTVTVLPASSRTFLAVRLRTFHHRAHAILRVRTSVPGEAKVTPTGAVRIYDGRRLVRTVRLTARGATIQLGPLRAGRHRLHVAFVGTPNVSGSGSRIVTVRVKPNRRRRR